MTVHYAQTLDGRIATRSGHSQWVSCAASLRLAHQLRAANDAILVGVGTVLVDDPQLTVRLTPGQSPLRVVVDTTLRLPLDARILSDRAAATLVATTHRTSPERIDAVRAEGAEVVVLPEGQGGVDLAALLRHLGARGVASVLVEGGASLITSTLRDRLVDRLVVCIAPKLIGSGIEAVGDLAIHRLHDALTFEGASFRRLGDDLIFDGTLRSGVAAVA